MIWFLLVIIGLFFTIQIFSLISISTTESQVLSSRKHYPKVSLLLAARNEERLIGRSLEAINKLDYPKDKIEILIGNDASTDKTSEIVTKFINGKPEFRLIQISENFGKARGKANVLAQLAREAKGEYFFITDVDVKLPPKWILSLLEEFTDEVGIVSGTTKCERGGLFATLQGIDWLHFMGYIKAFAHIGIGCTSVGNNMAVRREAYFQTGGYEEIDFSITEDYKLFQSVTDLGWSWRNVIGPDSLGLASYIPSIKEMLHQRKRWLIGAKDLPWNWKTMIILYGLFIPAVLGLATIRIELALLIWVSKFLIQSFFIFILCLRVDRKPFSFSQQLIYEVYVITNTLASAIFYMLPIKSIWKNRVYSGSSVNDIPSQNKTA